MRTQRAALAAVSVLLLLTGCAAPSATVGTVAEQISVEAADPRPDAEVPEAEVPIAAVAPEAEAVNEPDPEQAAGITMTTDKGKGLDADDVTDTALAGGCVPGYGAGGVCLPPVPPRLAGEHAGHAGMSGMEMAAFYNCNDVRDLIPRGIETVGDPLGLDSNGDGIACGKGDDV
ncbi:hypothetical protein F7P69_02030 [Cellulosimicrobium funkei]|nr:hypothetical protein [Cellulosimicrobium funkei]